MNEERKQEFEEIEQKSEKQKEAGKKKIVGVIKELLIYVLIFFAALYVVPNYVCARTVVDGPSMEETLQDDDSVLLDKLSYRFVDPKRFDVVVFYHFNDKSYQNKKDKDAYEFYVKRIIGLPGETVQIEGETIYINGEPLEENYGKDPIDDSGIAAEPITLGPDEYFVMGDNREVSKDSRDPDVGCVKRDWIAGKVQFRIYPLQSIGKIK